MKPRYLLVITFLVACKGSDPHASSASSGSASSGSASVGATSPSKSPTAPLPPAPPALTGSVACEAAPPAKLDGHPTLLRGVLVQLKSVAGTGLVLSVPGASTVLGTVPFPAGAEGSVTGIAETREGLAVLVKLHAAKGDAGTLQLARFNADGSPHGVLVPVPTNVVPWPIPAVDLGAFDDTLVVFAETKLMEHAQVQLMDLDAKPLGEAIDTGYGRVSQFARLGTSHTFAVFVRFHESDPDRVRMLDADKRAWLGPAMDFANPNIYATAPFGTTSIVMMGVGPHGIQGATLDATGMVSPWHTWASSDATGHGVLTMPDGTHSFAIWAEGHGANASVHVATIQPDLSLANDRATPGSELGSSAMFATNDEIFDGDGHYRCASSH